MDLKFLEVQSTLNTGLFALGRLTLDELTVPSASGAHVASAVTARGWSTAHIWVMDFQVGRAVCVDIMDLTPFHEMLRLGADFASPLFHDVLKFLAGHYQRMGGD